MEWKIKQAIYWYSRFTLTALYIDDDGNAEWLKL